MWTTKSLFFFPFKLNTMRAADVNPKFPAVQILTSHSTCSNPPGGAGEELHTGRKDAQSKAVAGLLCFPPPPLFMKAPPFQCVQQHHWTPPTITANACINNTAEHCSSNGFIASVYRRALLLTPAVPLISMAEHCSSVLCSSEYWKVFTWLSFTLSSCHSNLQSITPVPRCNIRLAEHCSSKP